MSILYALQHGSSKCPLPRSRVTIPCFSISVESPTLAVFSKAVPRAGRGAYSVFYSATNCLHLKGITVSRPSSASCPDARFCMKGHSGGGAEGKRGPSVSNNSFKSLTPSTEGWRMSCCHPEKQDRAGRDWGLCRMMSRGQGSGKGQEGVGHHAPMSPFTPRMRPS